MPRKGKGSPSPLKVITRNIRIALGGPPEREAEARGLLRLMIYRELRECDYFHRSMLDDKFARDIETRTPYVPTKVRKDIVVNIKSISIFYRNPPRGWQWWARIRDGINTITMGSSAEGEPELL